MTEFEAGSPTDQLALDPTPLSDGAGAIFVPSRSRPELEPHVRVLRGDEVVARGPTGRRLVVPAGHYRVLLGQGPEGWRATQSVLVRSGETIVADGFFGSLRVTAVDDEGTPAVVSYVIVSADGHRVYGPADTSADAAYEATRTWLLRPDSYRIVPGSDPDGVTGSVATIVSADHRARVRLLVDSTGIAVGSEPGDLEPARSSSAWRLRWLVGGNGALGQSRGQLNGHSGDAARLDVFTDLRVRFDRDEHLLSFGLFLEQSWVGFTRGFGRDVPFQKLDDRLRSDLEYVYRLARIVGPYARVSLRTAMLPNAVVADGDYTVVTTATDGTQRTSELADGESMDLMPAFAPLIVQESVGISLTLWDTRVFGAGLRTGAAGRQTFYHGGGRLVTGTDGEDGEQTVRLQVLDDSLHWGAEASAWLRLRVSEWVNVRSQVQLFVPLDVAVARDRTFRVVFHWTGDVSLRLAEWASLVYSVTLHRDDVAIAALQFRHSLTLRFQYAIF
jgi:hypothetical protein